MSDDATTQPGESPGYDDRYEQFKVRGEELIAKVRELVHEGNIRRIVIANADGETLVEFPVTLGVVGAVLVPVWAAVGAIAAIVTDCTITVERKGDDDDA